jgi:hypothetical protein
MFYIERYKYFVGPCCLHIWNRDCGRIKADSHIACRAHAVPLPCRAAKGLECV